MSEFQITLVTNAPFDNKEALQNAINDFIEMHGYFDESEFTEWVTEI